jgi:uncharacterized protein
MSDVERPILLVSDGLFHPSVPARFWLRRALLALPGYPFERVSSLEALSGEAAASYRAIVLYVHHEKISTAALDALDQFLDAGGGLLALHSASASYKNRPRFYDMLGGHFVEHGPVEEFLVEPAAAPDDIFRGLPAFSVRDELYRHEYDAANHVHFYTEVDGVREPVVWTRRHGRGRVCYCALGHTVGVMCQAEVQQIVQRGLVWAAGVEAELAGEDGEAGLAGEDGA